MESPSTVFTSPQMQEAKASIMTERVDYLDHYGQFLDLTDFELRRWHTVLEIGSGIEQGFAKAVKNAGYDTQIISVDPRLGLSESEDLSDMHPDEHQYRLRGRHNSEPNTTAALAQNLPFADQSIDAILANYSVPAYLSTQTEITAIIAEIQRVLKDNGEARLYPVMSGPKEEMVRNALALFPQLQVTEPWPVKQTGEFPMYLLKIKKVRSN